MTRRRHRLASRRLLPSAVRRAKVGAGVGIGPRGRGSGQPAAVAPPTELPEQRRTVAAGDCEHAARRPCRRGPRTPRSPALCPAKIAIVRSLLPGLTGHRAAATQLATMDPRLPDLDASARNRGRPTQNTFDQEQRPLRKPCSLNCATGKAGAALRRALVGAVIAARWVDAGQGPTSGPPGILQPLPPRPSGPTSACQRSVSTIASYSLTSPYDAPSSTTVCPR